MADLKIATSKMTDLQTVMAEAALAPLIINRTIKILNASLDMNNNWTCQYVVVNAETNDTLEGPFTIVKSLDSSPNLQALIAESTSDAIADYNKP